MNYIARNPCIYQRPQDPKKKNIMAELPARPVARPLNDAEVSAILQACQTNPGLSDIVWVFLHTGLRISELVNIQADWIHREGDYLLIPAEFSKNKENGRVAIVDEVKGILYKPTSGYVFPGWTQGRFRQALGRAKRRAGVKGRLRVHDLRHTFGQKYLENGGDLGELSSLLRHSSYAITNDTYKHYKGGHLRDKANRLVKYTGAA